jgi:hypothetical protein
MGIDIGLFTVYLALLSSINTAVFSISRRMPKYIYKQNHLGLEKRCIHFMLQFVKDVP